MTRSVLTAPTRSEMEEHLAWQMRAAKVPPWEPEFLFALEVGRRFRFDFAWPEQKVAVETDGGTWVDGRHNRGRGIHSDCVKFSLAAALGWRVLRLDTTLVENGYGLQLIEKALAS